MGKTIIKSIYALVVFLVAMISIDQITNKGNVDITTEMSEASFSVVHVVRQEEKINSLYGYAQKMDARFQCETITPVDMENRQLSFLADTYGNQINRVSYEVRSVDGERLVEDTVVDDFVQKDDTMAINIVLKDLLDKNKEYSFALCLTDIQGREIYYYTRVILCEDANHIDDEVEFALDFHSRTFDKKRAQEITKYLESNEEGDNTTYSKVTIHSSFAQITWGDLQVTKETEPEVYVRQSNPYVAQVELRYIVSLPERSDKQYFNVTEHYYLRFGKERMYLLNFERNMDSVFANRNAIYTNNKINLGITGNEVDMLESEDGNILVFVKENRLFSLNLTDNKLVFLFGFYDMEHTDPRNMYHNSDIRIISVDETGNVRFLVYGYMNRGNHEGGVGVTCYYYNSMLNTIEEEIYIPYDGSADLVRQSVKELAYVNNGNQLFIILDDAVYRIDLLSKSYETLVENLTYGSYKVSRSNRMIVWQDESDTNASRKLILLNLNTGKKREIDAGNGKYVKPLGFMNEDLIYGIAHAGNVHKDAFGAIVFPMYDVRIQDEDGNVLKNYSKPGIYVTEAEIGDNQINLKRVKASENAFEYSKIDEDQILNDVAAETDKNVIETVSTQEYEKIVQIAAKSSVEVEKMKYLTPKQVMYEGVRTINIPLKETQEECYYVYNAHGIQDITQQESDAILLAEKLSGRVLDKNGVCIWEKANRVAVNQIMKITEDMVSEERNSVAVCLDSILKYEGISRNSAQMLTGGKTVVSILQDNIAQAKVLDLSGCSLDSVLYYVGRDIPVMAFLNDGNAVLIVGYNELNTVIFNPLSGKIAKMGINDSKDYFEANGNSFFTYTYQN